MLELHLTHLSSRALALVGLSLGAVLLVACRTPPLPEFESTGDLSPAAPVSFEPRPNGPRPLPVVAPPAAADEFVTVLELAANLPLLHLRSGGMLVDFGHASRHKHTLGDWRSGWHGDFEKEGVTFSYGTGNGSTVMFDTAPEEAGQPLRVVVRARAEGGARLRLFLDGQGLSAVDLPSGEFGHVESKVPAGLTAGPHTLLLRGNGRRPTSDGMAAAFAVDYVRFEYGETGSQNAAASYSGLGLAPLGKDPAGLTLGPSESVTLHLVPPASAVLWTAARSADDQTGRLVVTARVDGEPAQELGAWPITAVERQLAIPLTHLAGQAVALTVRAEDASVLLPGAAIKVRPEAPVRPAGKIAATNLILVLIDTLRADKVTAYAPQTRVKTEALSALAGESMLFERATAAENWTKPSVASVLSGLHPATHGAKGDTDKVPSSVVLLPEHLGTLGYDTAGFVANGYVSGKFGFEQGWRTWTNYVREGKRNRAEFVFDEAAAWLSSRRSDKPFFLYVHTIDPHVPYFPPRRYLEMYDDQPYDGPIEGSRTADQLGKIKGKGMVLKDRDKQRLEALYDGEVTYHDDQLARFMKRLDELGLLTNTAIVVTSDHGEEFFEHGSVGHGHSLYEELLHVPLLVRLPGAQPGKGARSGVEATGVDIVPTACELLGVESPAGVEGRSLVPLLRGEGLPGAPRAGFSEFLAGSRSVRAGSFKAIFKGPRAVLYDLSADPHEASDVAARRPVALAVLRDLLGRHLGEQIDASSGQRRPRHRQEKAVIDDETKQQLKALGYLQD